MYSSANCSSIISRAGKLIVLVTFLVIGFGLLSFSGFVNEIRNSGHATNLSDVDGVVVLTGGAKRIETAITVFEASYGKRLLISGVAPGTTRGDLGRLLGRTHTMFGCCVDIDRKALDTRGNAKYTARWARLNDFDKLIVVTNSYHIPRSMMLMKRKMPDVELVALPVHTVDTHGAGFWSVATSPRVLKEFVKYTIAKIGAEPPIASFRSAVIGINKQPG